MKTSNGSRGSLGIRLFLAIAFIHLLLVEYGSAGDAQALASNIKVQQSEGTCKVSYDLLGEMNGEYTIVLEMVSKSDEHVRYTPKNLQGSFGNGVKPGENLSIEWNYTEEYPAGLSADDYYFRVNAMAPEETSISPWIWIGAVLVVGVVVYLLVKKDKEEVPDEFPQPPGRP